MAKKKLRKISLIKKDLEDLVKLWCKKRDNYKCQKCGVHVEGSNAHGSHVIPVSAGNQFRFDPLNIKTLCYHHHINWWHKNPIEAAEWFREKFPDRHEYLFGKPRKTVKFTRDDYAEMTKHYKQLNNG